MPEWLISTQDNQIQKDGMATALDSGMALEALTFTLGKEEYGIDIQKVQEIRPYENVTRIASAPVSASAAKSSGWWSTPSRMSSL
jgi:chemotaxis signal transduction protein